MRLYISSEHTVPLVIRQPNTIVIYDIGSVNYTSTFEVDWEHMSEVDKAAFRTSFIQATATELGVSPEDIFIHEITVGSAVVDASVYVQEGSAVTIDSIETKLTTETSPISVMHNGVRVGSTISAFKKGFASRKGEKPKKRALGSIVSPSDITQDSAVLTWTDDDNGDATVQKYIIYANDVEKGEVSAGEELTFTVEGLDPDTDYTFKVRKVTDLGNVDSTGMYSIQRKVFTGGAGTYPVSTKTYTTLGREATEQFERYAEGTGYGDDVDEIYFNSGTHSHNNWAIIKSLSGMYYSIGVHHSASNRLGRLDAGGSMDPNTEHVHVRVPNDILNTFLATNPTKKIKKIACSTYSAFVLMEDGTLYTYGSGSAVATINATTSKTELVVASLYTELMNQGWVGHDVFALRSGVGVHLKHDSLKDRIYFSGKDEYNGFGLSTDGTKGQELTYKTVETSPVENPAIKQMIEDFDFVVEEIRGMDVRCMIKMNGEWFGWGNTGGNKTLGISFTEDSRAFPGAPDPLELGSPQNYTGPIKLDGLNKFLTDNPGSIVNISTSNDITIYTPEGKFYFHRNQSSTGQKFPRTGSGVSVPTDENPNPNESPYMDLSYIGDAAGHNGIGFLENVNGTFIKFYHFSTQGAFLMSTKTETTVKTAPAEAEP